VRGGVGMTMIRVTVGTVVVTWSPEYGFTVAGGEATVEEVEPRDAVVNVPVFTQADLEALAEKVNAAAVGPARHLAAVPTSLITSSEPLESSAPPPPKGNVRCGVCNHPIHPPDACEGRLDLGDGKRMDCDCATPFPA